jgi:putative membrane protein
MTLCMPKPKLMNLIFAEMKPPLLTPNLAIVVLSILYSVGIAGILLPIHDQFILLTPINLLVSLGIVLYFHKDWNAAIYRYLIIAYVVGFSAEVFGIQTGLLFGEYQYGPVLGWKIWGTPLMIGVNWVMLGYCAGVLANVLLKEQHWALRGTLAALLMVGLDVIIEPVAIAYDFWHWEQVEVPLKNYIGWFLVALPLECLFTFWLPNVRNKVAIALFILQILFFGILGSTL